MCGNHAIAGVWERQRIRRIARAKELMHAGVIKYSRLRQPLAHLVLTTTIENDPDKLRRDFQVFIKRLRYIYNKSVQYVRVRTEEGNGTLHILINLPYFPKKRLNSLWEAISGAKITFIRRINYGKGLINYILPHLAKQSARISSSWNWIYRGWRKVYDSIRRGYYREHKPKNFASIPLFCHQAYTRWLSNTYSSLIRIESLKPLAL